MVTMRGKVVLVKRVLIVCIHVHNELVEYQLLDYTTQRLWEAWRHYVIEYSSVLTLAFLLA